MVFTSFYFIIIVIITFLLYWNIKRGQIQNLILIIGSYTFYCYFSGWECVILLLIMSTFSFLLGNKIVRNKRKSFLTLGIILNLIILGFFKYYNFFIENVINTFDLIGIHAKLELVNWLMPMGLSFYTFMLISHLIDCHRGVINLSEIKADSFYAYVSFFPHLVAGPIDRSRKILPQLNQSRRFSFGLAREGMWQILNGLFKKMVIADLCAIVVNNTWADILNQNSYSLLISVFLYAIQIYCDFSGFSDIAIGIGKLFGLRLMQNFQYPYFARNISEFWRRWHISLTSWFTEYLYIPLGGSRQNLQKTILNTLIIFILCGFWHGANWLYILWGLVCGLLFIPYLLQKNPIKYKSSISKISQKDLINIALTFIVISFTWIIFYGAEAGISSTIEFFRVLIKCDFTYTYIPFFRLAFAFSVVLMFIEWTQRKQEFALSGLRKLAIPLRWSIYIMLILIIAIVYLIMPQEASTDTFIYQNF